MTTSEKIRHLRKQHGLTQTELGERLGVKKNAVSKWECGRVEEIPSSKIKAMAILFGVAPSFLIDDEQAIAPIPSPVPLIDLITRQYGKGTVEALNLYSQLDIDDQGEIRGEMKQMLKSEKYFTQDESKNA